jgi:hypothetical protein
MSIAGTTESLSNSAKREMRGGIGGPRGPVAVAALAGRRLRWRESASCVDGIPWWR